MTDTSYQNRSFSLADGITRRQAQKNLKSHLNHVEVMKNRLKVLSSQAQYNKYRENYQSYQIQKHFKIHEELVKERVQVDEVCKTFDNSKQKRQANIKMKKDIEEKLSSVYAHLKQQKQEQSKQVKLRSKKNSEFLSRKRKQQLEQRRIMKQNVQKWEGEIKQSISRYKSEKFQDLKEIKMMEKRSMCELNEKVIHQLQQLSNQEKQLIELGSKSLQASRMKNQQYQQIYGTKQKLKKLNLPGITAKTMDQSFTIIK